MRRPDFSSFFERFNRDGDRRVSVLDSIVNAAFGMNYTAGVIRLQLLVLGFFVLWFFIAFSSHPPQEWQKSFMDFISPGSEPGETNLVVLLVTSLLALDVVGHLIALYIPYYLALQFAAIFLDDIFELKDASVARDFITRAAFVLPRFGTMHIENGDVRQADTRSPIFKIGGPGRVRVSLENVAVFEKINGEPEIIGPTSGNRFFTRTLDGFERLRQVIDIRDLTMTINELTSRTKDGIPITVQNIRMLFSVVRDTPYTTLNRPYPYSQDAILKLVYDQSKGPWTAAIVSLVRSELLAFIGEHTLDEIFAAVGQPEVKRQIERQSVVQRHVWRHRNRSRRYRVFNEMRDAALVRRAARRGRGRKFLIDLHPRRSDRPLARSLYRKPGRLHLPARWGKVIEPALPARLRIPRRPAGWKPWTPLPFRSTGARFQRGARPPVLFNPDVLSGGRNVTTFVPRPQLSQRFYEEFARSFPERASKRGVRLEWIDVGTWHPPADDILTQNLEAWRLTTDSIILRDRIVLENLRLQAQANEMLRLVRSPIFRFIELQKQGLPREEIVHALVEEYLGQLRAERDEFMRDGTPLPERLQPALRQIQNYQRDYLEQNKKVHYLDGT